MSKSKPVAAPRGASPKLAPNTSEEVEYDIVGPYVLTKTIGQGMYAKVKLGEDEFRQQVAVKIFDKNKIQRTPHALLQVEKEINALRSCDHPNIVQFHEVLETESKVFLVMEYLTHGELYDFISTRGKLSEQLSRRLFAQIVSAVHHCHAKGIAHRDLKPENILLNQQQNIKLVDFGLSNYFLMPNSASPSSSSSSSASASTSTSISPSSPSSSASSSPPSSASASLYPNATEFLSTQCGSPHYAAPEILLGHKYRGPNADIWSMGVLLYAMVCGSLPFTASNMPALVRKITDGRFSLPSGLSADVCDLVTRMIQVDPTRRLNLQQIKDHPWMKATDANESTSFDCSFSQTPPSRHRPEVMSVMEARSPLSMATQEQREWWHSSEGEGEGEEGGDEGGGDSRDEEKDRDKEAREDETKTGTLDPSPSFSPLTPRNTPTPTTSSSSSASSSRHHHPHPHYHTMTLNPKREVRCRNCHKLLSVRVNQRGDYLLSSSSTLQHQPQATHSNVDLCTCAVKARLSPSSASPSAASSSASASASNPFSFSVPKHAHVGYSQTLPRNFEACFLPDLDKLPLNSQNGVSDNGSGLPHSHTTLGDKDAPASLFREFRGSLIMDDGQLDESEVDWQLNPDKNKSKAKNQAQIKPASKPAAPKEEKKESKSVSFAPSASSSSSDSPSSSSLSPPPMSPEQAKRVRALQDAAKKGDVKFVLDFIQQAPPAMRYGESWLWSSLLLQSSSSGNLALAKALLTADVALNVNAVDEKRYSPLMHASANGHVEMVRLLLSYRAAIHTISTDGKTAIFLAREGKHQSIARLLTDSSSTRRRNTVDSPGHSLTHEFFRATEAGDGAKVKHLLKLAKDKDKADIDLDVRAKGIDNFTALHFAARKGHTEIAQQLLQAQPPLDVNALTKSHWTPLMMAAHRGHVAIVKALLEHGADPMIVSTDGGFSALKLAHEQKLTDIVNILQQAINDRWQRNTAQASASASASSSAAS